MTGFTIGKLAKYSDVPVETIRYYERNGFLPEADRLPSGYRVYGSDAVNRVRFIKEAKELGFTLREVSELFGITDNPDADCATINKKAQAKLVEIKSKISRLKKVRASLEKLATYCPADEQPLTECSIMNHLYGQTIDVQ